MREANISVSDSEFEKMGIHELIEMGREAGLTDFEELTCRGNGAVVQAEVESRYDEEALDALDYVDEWQYVTETENGHVYVISFTAPALPDEMAEQADEFLGTCDPELDRGGTSMSLVGRQESISELMQDYEGAGVSPELERLGSYRGPERPLDDLTDRQREVISTAHEMGFYEVPREASTEEIAGELDVDPSTVAEHLQRAERNLLDDLL